MDNGACNVIYLDRRAVDEHVRRNTLSESWAARSSSNAESPGYFNVGRPRNPAEVLSNIEAILAVFHDVHVCNSCASCLNRLSELNASASDSVPTIILIDVPYDEELRIKRLSREPRTPSPTSLRRLLPDHTEPIDLYGYHLLQHLGSEIQQKVLSKLAVPVVMLSGLDRDLGGERGVVRSPSGSRTSVDSARLLRYIDAGAVDVYTSPLNKDHVHGLAVHAYRARRDASKEDSSFLMSKRNRKISWVGVDEAKPYAYLREAMVSQLMSGICNPEMIGDTLDPSDVQINPERQKVVAEVIGRWDFSAHDFTDDELLHAALLMLQHALDMPELEHWRMDSDELTMLLLASRTAYNNFVYYHNFRHVTDVLQALFYFLVQIGILPPYPSGSAAPRKSPQPAIASLLKPFDALTLLVSAIGHDVGHPGVNNAFLVALNSPLAQLYNDRSVLESFHCAAFSQILRRYWPGAFSDAPMRKLMINSILATDMGLHFKYMTDLGNLQEKLAHNNNTLDGWDAKKCEEFKDLLCGLLIKCADISNVARKFDTAATWARILTDEFSNQGIMEQELQIPTCLFGGPPVLDSVIKMAESQIGFMNIFAQPLFEAMSDVLPSMRFSLEEILTNKSIWKGKIEEEKQKKRTSAGMLIPSLSHDPGPSPFSELPIHLGTKPQQLEGSNAEPMTKTTAGAPQLQFTAAATSSRRSSFGIVSASEKGSRRSSRQLQPSDDLNSSRRGSADASITTILVTHNQQGNTEARKESDNITSNVRSNSPENRKVGSKTGPTMLGVKEDRNTLRPSSAPYPAKANSAPTAHDLANMPPPTGLQYSQNQIHAQSHSETDLSHNANGSVHHLQSPSNWEVASTPSQESGDWAREHNDRAWSQNRNAHAPNPGRWKTGNWRRDGSKAVDVSTRQETGGFLGPVTSSTSGNSSQGRKKEKFGMRKIWNKLTSNGDRDGIYSTSPRDGRSRERP